MIALEPVADPRAPLARRNPVAKLAAALLFSFALVVTVDPVAPAIAIAMELALLPLFGVRYGVLLRRTWPLLIGAVGIVVAMVLFAAERDGPVLLSAGPVVVTSGVLMTTLGLVLRMFAVALPGVIVFATTDATDLADALIQNVRAPARFAIGALAAFRLVPLLGQEWQMISMARRARGVEAGRNPVAKLKLFVSTAFALLVGAIRRGSRLAVAMDARGFDAGTPRTVARRQHFTAADAALIAGALLLAAVALGGEHPARHLPADLVTGRPGAGPIWSRPARHSPPCCPADGGPVRNGPAAEHRSAAPEGVLAGLSRALAAAVAAQPRTAPGLRAVPGCR